MTQTRVIYLLGWFRSGSTVIANLLGQLPGAFCGGEIRSLFGNGLLLGRSCGCGSRLVDCPVWSTVFAKVLGQGVDGVGEGRRIVAQQRELLRLRNLPALLSRRSRSSSRGSNLRAYSDLMASVYAAITAATGAEVIIDSSKRPADAAVLRRVEGVTPSFVHLVRDPRSVVLSETASKAQLDPTGPAEMPRRRTLVSASGWLRTNAAADLVRRGEGDRALLLRYEDFVAEPHRAFNRLVAELGLTVGRDGPFLNEREATVSPTHTVAGNADRFRAGRITIRPEGQWQTTLPARQMRAATLLTLPLLHRYGYPVRGTTRPGKGSPR